MEAEAIPQRSAEWHKQRMGRFTSSEIYTIVGKTAAFTDGAHTYVMQQVAERLTGLSKETPTTKAMQWGIDNEPLAKKWAAKIKGWEIVDTEFVLHDTLNWGGSGDGWIRNINAACEVKCLDTVNHLKEIKQSETYEDLKKNLPKRFWQVLSDAILRDCDKMVMIYFDPRIESKWALVIREYDIKQEDKDLLISRIQMAEKIFNEHLNYFN